jgi:outer membrane protein assembly factor BamB
MKKLLLVLAILRLMISCNSSSMPKEKSTKIENTTLLVATEGCLYNFNIDKNKIAWQYCSPIDSLGNRNLFVLDGQNVFLPFESGKFINFDVNTGKIMWQHQFYGTEDEVMVMSSDQAEQTKMLKSLMPLIMSKSLVDDQNIIIASMGQPSKTSAWLYNFNRKDGSIKWHNPLPTVFNFFAPIKHHDNYFVNSAVFLKMYTANNGTDTSYGMFDGEALGQSFQNYENNQFEKPIYNQMQTDGKSLFIGDESGKFYCLELDKNSLVEKIGYSDPNNTFIKNSKVFKWIFSNENFNFQSNSITFLEDKILYAEMKNSMATQSCIFALNTVDGKPKWQQIINGSILNWKLNNGKIVGHTACAIFYLDADGQNFIEIKIESKPLSNIEWFDKIHLIYVTQKGIELFDTHTKVAKVIFSKQFKENEHNNVQIKFMKK